MPQTVATHPDAAPTAVRSATERGVRPWSHLAGLDGLRAIAVLAVVAYHAGFGVPQGGFLGVEVFFVISGYLITALLLAEHRRAGRIDPVRFWLRRARRLLPALFFLLAVTLAVAMVAVPGEIARLRPDALAALGYVTNWHLIAGDQSYFETVGRPSLYLHLWSLAIEEQFYLVWPLALSVVLLAGRRAGLALTVAGAAGSAIWMALLFQPGTDPSRLYYGTDTRLTGLLLGAALAYLWVPVTAPADASGAAIPRIWTSRRVGRLVDLLGVAGLAGLAWAFVAADAFEPSLYQGGFALVAVATVAVIAAAVHPRGRLGALLDTGPMRWIGTRSYGIYLWHWPIFTLTRPGIDLPLDPVAVLAIRLGLTAVAAEFSFRFVEAPIRAGAIERAWRRLRRPGAAVGRTEPRWSTAVRAGAVAVLLSAVVVSVAMATPPAPPVGMVTGSIDGLVLPADASPAASRSAARSPAAATPAASPHPVHSPAPPAASLNPPTTAAPARPAHDTTAPSVTASPAPSSGAPSATATPAASPPILAFGESVMLQSAAALAHDLGPVRVDAAVGRQIGEGITILERREASGSLAQTVIVQLGNNGPFYDGQFDEVMAALRDVPTVIWINVRVPREWEAHNNRIIASGVARYPNARMVDWNAATAGRPDLFWNDGYHPKPEGAKLYADLVAAALK
ncbi:MAG: acyltransferase [Chloroflexi bacterium]|nr:acyltransferase [Chloroflexota bacterium]